MSADHPGVVLRSLLLSMESLGHDARGALARLSRPGRKMNAWDELVTALESFFSVEGVSTTQRLMQHWATHAASVLVATELLAEPMTTFQVLLEAASGQSLVSVSHRPADGGGLTVSLELMRGARPSMVFFQSCVWFLAAVPRARGLGDARVLPERLSERELHCLVLPPTSGARVALGYPQAHLKAVARELYPHVVTAAPTRALPTAQTLQARFGLTRAEARVVRRLAEGLNIKRIAAELRVSPETARTHAKRAMQKTDTHRQAELVSLVLQGEQ